MDKMSQVQQQVTTRDLVVYTGTTAGNDQKLQQQGLVYSLAGRVGATVKKVVVYSLLAFGVLFPDQQRPQNVVPPHDVACEGITFAGTEGNDMGVTTDIVIWLPSMPEATTTDLVVWEPPTTTEQYPVFMDYVGGAIVDMVFFGGGWYRDVVGFVFDGILY